MGFKYFQFFINNKSGNWLSFIGLSSYHHERYFTTKYQSIVYYVRWFGCRNVHARTEAKYISEHKNCKSKDWWHSTCIKHIISRSTVRRRRKNKKISDKPQKKCSVSEHKLTFYPHNLIHGWLPNLKSSAPALFLSYLFLFLFLNNKKKTIYLFPIESLESYRFFF